MHSVVNVSVATLLVLLVAAALGVVAWRRRRSRAVQARRRDGHADSVDGGFDGPGESRGWSGGGGASGGAGAAGSWEGGDAGGDGGD